MTLSTGNTLAKVEKDESGEWQIVKGEINRVFQVGEIEHIADDVKKAVLKVVE